MATGAGAGAAGAGAGAPKPESRLSTSAVIDSGLVSLECKETKQERGCWEAEYRGQFSIRILNCLKTDLVFKDEKLCIKNEE